MSKETEQHKPIEATPYNLKRIAWELERTALGDVFYGNAVRVTKDMPITSKNRSVLERFATGTQTGLDHVVLQSLAQQLRFLGTGNPDRSNIMQFEVNAKRVAQYQVVNSLGQIVKTFGKDFQGAKEFAKKTEDCGGLWCGLRVKRYYVKSTNLCRICKCMPCECEDPNIPF